MTCVFLGIIGNRLDDSDLKYVEVEPGILGENTAQKVLRGKDLNNGMRAHLYVAEPVNYSQNI